MPRSPLRISPCAISWSHIHTRRPLPGELERRAHVYPDELTALLAEYHAVYLAARKTLLVPRVMEEIRRLGS
ncbi:hypothetical protein CVT25_015932 [Psilocybe cyanescens]|uniref:Uncharacterized protein n=1 Tax=Psilocybe cyanescens TaxID=93625 RepID=A0A409WSF6_PSICY|nr:hypothetical protein CVT25_015932 [Psilocybe cyanescens]